MSELPRVELPSLQAQSDQVLRMGGARAAARDTLDRAERDYELELHTQTRTEEVQAAEKVESADDQHAHDRGSSPGGHRRQHDDDPDDEPHLLDVTA